MAIISKIRDNGWLVLVIIGGALVAFIMGDFLKGGGAEEPKYGLGTMYGEKVDFEAFNEAVALAEENTRRNAAQQGQQPQPVDQSAVWRQFIEKLLLEKEYEALGINVGEAEFDAYLYGRDGFTVLADLEKNFIDSLTKAFNPKLLEKRIDEMMASDDAEIRKGWEDSKEYYTERRKQEKYFDIIGQGMYSTSLEAKDEYLAQNEVKNISYVLKRYRDIKESDFEPTDKQLKAYFEKHKTDRKYQVKVASRKAHFFDILINPSAKDSSDFNDEIAELKAGLIASTDDSTYVMAKSDLRFYSSGPFSTALPKTHANAQQSLTYPAANDSSFAKATIGTVVGPYEEEGVTNIAKVIGFTYDTINARHILIGVQQGEDPASIATKQALADTIMANINDDNFVDYVKRYSEDTGSKEKDGDLGDFFFSSMVQPFAAYVGEKPIGEIGLVQSQFGFHIVQVTGRRGRQYPRLAVIQKTLKASDKTKEERDSEAYKLLYMLDDKLTSIKDLYKKVEKFDTLVAREGYLSRPMELKDNDPVIRGFTTKYAEDKVLELMFAEDAQIGTLVGSPVKDKTKHIIAIYAGTQAEGEPVFEEVRESMRQAYIKEQSVKRFKSQMKGKSLDNIADATVQKSDVSFANPQISSGFEPAVVGAIYAGLKDGERTLPIEGNSGVYVVKLEKTTAAPTSKDFEKERLQMLANMRGTLQNQAKQSLYKLADVIDNRRLFNTNVRR
ncbi:MAG: peptidyl-prolyl cis-trans isomerase D [Flavobacteriaceae bacterium]|jgi:peptidyl-prolyl cis-trans isomerase D